MLVANGRGERRSLVELVTDLAGLDPLRLVYDDAPVQVKDARGGEAGG